jgi:hypothetical protein
MIVLEVDKVEIDHCTACGGVWLDSGELELLLEDASNKDDLARTLVELTEGRAARKKRCPLCARRLNKVMYGPERDLELDRCPRGHGIWFDRDELCRALQLGKFEKGRPVYDILNDIFGGTCRSSPEDGPKPGGSPGEGVSKGS